MKDDRTSVAEECCSVEELVVVKKVLFIPYSVCLDGDARGCGGMRSSTLQGIEVDGFSYSLVLVWEPNWICLVESHSGADEIL